MRAPAASDLARSALWVIALAACSEGPYVIGEQSAPPARYCPSGTDCRGRFELPLARAGTEVWGDGWVAGAIRRTPTLLLRGEDATSTRWAPRTGGALASAVGAEVGARGPFTDGTRAVELAHAFASSGPLVWLGGSELVVELVLRAAPSSDVLRAEGASRSLIVRSDEEGALMLLAGDVALRTRPLVSGAWYHVVLELRANGASTITVNGAATEGEPVPDAPEDELTITIGGGAPTTGLGARLAWLAIVPLGDATLGASAVRERFAQLTGVVPSLAGGAPLPIEIAREGAAFSAALDETGARRLHLVGEDWLRVTCLRDAADETFCGYLAEPRSTRGSVPMDPQALEPIGASIDAVDTDRSIGDVVPMGAVRGAPVVGPHGVALELEGSGALVLSFFARAASASVIEASLEGVGAARLDLAAGTVVSADAAIAAHLEPHGDGLWRIALSARAVPGATTRATIVAVRDGSTDFVGDGSSLFELAGMQSEVNRSTPTSLVWDMRGEDHLVFAASGNVPAGSAGRIRARVLSAPIERLHDQAIVHVSEGALPEEQLSVYASVLGTVIFTASQDAEIRWLVPSVAAVDALALDVEATWDASRATVSMRGDEQAREVTLPLDVARFDRLAIGFTASTSGAFDGLVGSVGLGPR